VGVSVKARLVALCLIILLSWGYRCQPIIRRCGAYERVLTTCGTRLSTRVRGLRRHYRYLDNKTGEWRAGSVWWRCTVEYDG
jgi:hypothetical protein